MRYAVIITLLAGLLHGQPPSAIQTQHEKPLVAEDKEAVSTAMLHMQAAQLNLFLETQRLQAEVDKMTQVYMALLAKMRAKYEAKNCELTLEKAWICPTIEKDSSPPESSSRVPEN